jgi:uncharacterized membrane protein YbhN (UPF0104 family)
MGADDSPSLLPSEPPPHESFFARNAGKLVASAVITTAMVAMLKKGGLSFTPSQGFSSLRVWTLPAYLVTLAGVSWFRATRWRFLLRSFATLPLRRLVAVSWIGFAAILLMPFRLGELVRPYLVRKKGELSLTSATSTIVAERVVDGLFLSIVLAIALFNVPTVDPLPLTVVSLPVSVLKVRQAGYAMLGVFTAAFIVIAVFYFARAWAITMTRTIIGAVSPKLADKLAATAAKLADGLHCLGSWRDAGPFLAETTAYWFLNALGMWLLAWGCGVVHADGSAPTFGEACAIMGLLGVTILVPGPPGLLGVFQLGIYAGMTMYYPTSVVQGPGSLYVFLMYACQVLWTVGAAGFFVAKGEARGMRSGDLVGASDDDVNTAEAQVS